MEISRSVIGRTDGNPYEISYGIQQTRGMFITVYRIGQDGTVDDEHPVYDENERDTSLGVDRAMWIMAMFHLSTDDAAYFLQLHRAYKRGEIYP